MEEVASMTIWSQTNMSSISLDLQLNELMLKSKILETVEYDVIVP